VIITEAIYLLNGSGPEGLGNLSIESFSPSGPLATGGLRLKAFGPLVVT
jgi:hypothetical protein